jgi:hypothetical protein
MAVAAPISYAGQIHVFQGAAGSLYHKWTNGDGAWFNENLFNAAGIGLVGLPNQLPGVAVINDQLQVTVEDDGGRAWYFIYLGGRWGVSELP